MKWLLAAFLALAAPCATAQPVAWTTYTSGNIGTPVVLGTAAAGAAAAVITTANDAPANQFIGVLVASVLATPVTTDTVSNTYSTSTNGAGLPTGAAYAPSPTHLGVGGQITVAPSSCSPTCAEYALAVTVPGVRTSSPLDNLGTQATGTSTSPSATEGTVVNASRIVFGEVFDAQNGVTSEAAGWTSDGTTPSGSGSYLHVAHKIVNTATAQTYNPTLGSSIGWTSITISFKSK